MVLFCIFQPINQAKEIYNHIASLKKINFNTKIEQWPICYWIAAWIIT